jgi:DNA-binding HxlR family transcriptional regulator
VWQGDGCGRGAGTHHLVERVDGERFDPDPDLAGRGLGGRLLDEPQHIRPAELVEHDDSWHGDSSASGAGFTARGRRYGAVGYLLVPSIFMQNAAGPAFLADCPTRLAVEIISDKWAVLVLFGLSQQPRRHGELAGLIGGISRKVLTQTLRRLQEYGLVERHADAPRRVEYRLTDLGRTLVEPIEVLNNWARDYGEAIADFQEAAEAAASARARAAG